jgi:transcription elongation factor Elf1
MNIESASIEFECPDCGFINSVSISDVINGASLICIGCLKTIQLVDGDGETKRAIDDVNQAFDDLGKVF